MLDSKKETGSNGNTPLNVTNQSKYEGMHPYTSGGPGIAENKDSNINTCFVLMHTIVIAMGFLQFGKSIYFQLLNTLSGIGLGSWGNIFTCF